MMKEKNKRAWQWLGIYNIFSIQIFELSAIIPTNDFNIRLTLLNSNGLCECKYA